MIQDDFSLKLMVDFRRIHVGIVFSMRGSTLRMKRGCGEGKENNGNVFPSIPVA